MLFINILVDVTLNELEKEEYQQYLLDRIENTPRKQKVKQDPKFLDWNYPQKRRGIEKEF